MEKEEMNHSAREIIRQLELFMSQSDYENALKLVETTSSSKFLSKEDTIDYLLLETQLRIKTGEFKKGISIIIEILSREENNIYPLKLAEALVLKTEISWRLGNFDDGLQAVEECEQLLAKLGGENEQDVKNRKKGLYSQGGINYWYKGDLEKATTFHEKCLQIAEEENDKISMADSYNNLGLVYQSKGEFDLSLEYYQKTLGVYEELGGKRKIAKLLSNIGITYSYRGDQEQALNYLQRSHAIVVKSKDKHDIAKSLLNIGAIFRMQGDITNAFAYYQKGQRIYEDIEDKRGIALALNNLGDVYQLKGDLDLALEYFQESLTLYEELGIKQDIAMALVNIGELYRTKRNLEWALRYFERGLALYEELKSEPSVAIVLYQLVLLALESNEPNLAQEPLKRLGQIHERTQNRIVKHRYLIANALFLKSQKRVRQKMKAEEILAQVVEEEVVDHALTVTAMIHLCDLLLFELKTTGEEEILREVKDLTKRLHEIAKEQSSHSLLTETYVLQSKLALLEMDVNKAQDLLNVALLNAEDKGLRTLAIKIYSEKTLLDTQIEKWKFLIKRKAPLRERLELTRLEDLITRVASDRLEVTETEVEQYSGRAKKITTKYEEVPKRKYQLKHINLIENTSKVEKPSFRVGVAQIGVSQTGDLLNEFYDEKISGLFLLKKEKVEAVKTKLSEMLELAHGKQVNILLFPEMAIDLGYKQLLEELTTLAKTYNMFIIPGSFHDQKSKKNISMVIGPTGVLWEQEKHIPAIIHYQGRRFTEGIEVGEARRETIICTTEFGTIAIAICRDFLDMDLRVELKNSEPPVDLIFNPAFTPVTEDFQAAHFDARRSIFAYCFFANIAEVGNSFIFTPERDRDERKIAPKEESIIYKDVDLFRLRSERKRWEIEQAKRRPFIQSTRS
jgi:tetratricopeptide (TPR) repeat protein